MGMATPSVVGLLINLSDQNNIFLVKFQIFFPLKTQIYTNKRKKVKCVSRNMQHTWDV